jgi:hypothetical protein
LIVDRYLESVFVIYEPAEIQRPTVTKVSTFQLSIYRPGRAFIDFLTGRIFWPEERDWSRLKTVMASLPNVWFMLLGLMIPM